jgi:hypothetical protein
LVCHLQIDADTGRIRNLMRIWMRMRILFDKYGDRDADPGYKNGANLCGSGYGTVPDPQPLASSKYKTILYYADFRFYGSSKGISVNLNFAVSRRTTYS